MRHKTGRQAGESEKKSGALMPLDAVGSGRTVRVEGIGGGRRLVSRLTEMGIYPGSELCVTVNSGGPVIVIVKGSRFSLGRGMANKIVVRA